MCVTFVLNALYFFIAHSAQQEAERARFVVEKVIPLSSYMYVFSLVCGLRFARAPGGGGG